MNHAHSYYDGDPHVSPTEYVVQACAFSATVELTGHRATIPLTYHIFVHGSIATYAIRLTHGPSYGGSFTPRTAPALSPAPVLGAVAAPFFCVESWLSWGCAMRWTIETGHTIKAERMFER